MKKLAAIILAITCLVCVTACEKEVSGVDVYFKNNSVVTTNFTGLGVEWGVYEDTNKLATGAWDKIISAMDRLNPALVRCMTNLDWHITDFNDNGTYKDPYDDTWSYNFDNKYMKSACDVLDYCQAKGIKVAFGVWNVPGESAPYAEDDGSDDFVGDTFGIIPNSTSDIRWAQMVADLMDFMVNVKGYTCIKWFVNTNEPNYSGERGTSKNAYNTYKKWEQGVRNVREALDAAGLQAVDIIGGDTTGLTGSREYLHGIATNLADVVNNYGIHMYVNDIDLYKATYQKNIQTQLYDMVKGIDGALGKTKDLIIWEAGMWDGKDTITDCNGYIKDNVYGLRMADYTVQSILAGVNGIVYWDLDDAMHYMYTENGTNAKEWGMFSTLGSASAADQEFRPWYHSSVLLTNLLQSGNTVYSANNTAGKLFRTLATVSADRTKGGFVAINRDSSDVSQTFCLQQKVKGSGKLYVYVFSGLSDAERPEGSESFRIGSDGYVVPNYVIDGSLNNKTTLVVPAKSMVVVSSERL